MKKLLLLFAVLLTTVGAWAQTAIKITDFDATKYYRIYSTTRGATHAIVPNSSNKGAMAVYEGATLDQVWQFIPGEGENEGKYLLKHYKTNVYLGKVWGGTGVTVYSDASNEDVGYYEMMPHATDDALTAFRHSGSDNPRHWLHNEYPTLNGWNGNGHEYFFLEEVEIKQEVTVTYTFTFNDEVKYTQEIIAMVGGDFPNITMQFPLGVQATKPEGIVTVDNANQTIELTIGELPFVVSSDYASAHWYALKIRDDGFTYLKYDSEKDYIIADDASYSVKSLPNYLWAFIGNPFDGFKIINKAAGSEMLLSAPAAPAGNKDNLARMIANTAGNEVWTFEVPTHGGAASDVFYVQHPTAKSYAFNRQDYDNTRVLCYWTDRDTGSALKVEEVYDFSQFGDLLFSDEQMQDGKIYRIQSSTRKTFTGIDGYTCNMKNQDYDANNPGQLWKYVVDGDKAYLQNVYAGLYPQYVNGGGDQTTSIGTSKDYAFTYSINNTNVEHIWNIFFGGRQVNIESNGNVNWWNGENAHHYIYEEEVTEDELATMCMNWYNANKYVAPAATASSYQKIAIDENATEIISPSEFAAPSVINEAIDNLAAIEGTLGMEITSAGDIHSLFGALSVYASAVNALAKYKNAVTAHGELLSIAYTPKAEWGTIILPINWANPEGWTRYSCASTEGNVLALTEYASDANKNTPLIVSVPEAKIGTTYQLIGYSNGAGTENVTIGLLTGVLEENTMVPAGSYVLARQKSTGKIGFFPVAENADYGLEKYKCYLTLPASESRYNALFFEGGETAIENVESAENAAKPVVYDLAGRRVQNAQKGVFIVNGKVVIK